MNAESLPRPLVLHQLASAHPLASSCTTPHAHWLLGAFLLLLGLYTHLPFCPKGSFSVPFPLYSHLNPVTSGSSLQIPVQMPFLSSLESCFPLSQYTGLCLLITCLNWQLISATVGLMSDSLTSPSALWGEGLNFCLLTIITSSASLALPDSSSSIIIWWVNDLSS